MSPAIKPVIVDYSALVYTSSRASQPPPEKTVVLQIGFNSSDVVTHRGQNFIHLQPSEGSKRELYYDRIDRRQINSYQYMIDTAAL